MVSILLYQYNKKIFESFGTLRNSDLIIKMDSTYQTKSENDLLSNAMMGFISV